jgi:DNA-directed RNA polymerase specialized sigma subunit
MIVMKCDNPAKRFLHGYRALIARRDSLMREIDSLRETITGTTVQLKQDVVTGSGASDRMGETVARIIDAEEALGGAIEEINKRLTEILRAIDSVHDETQKAVLTMRYIEGMTWQNIALRISYEERQTYVIHGRALQEINCWLKERSKMQS